ncbi:hypothetical protein CRUP_016217, partial [Coryphaenoides rupestris]
MPRSKKGKRGSGKSGGRNGVKGESGRVMRTRRRSAKTRQAALESLRQAFSSRVLYDFLTERRVTVTDCLERCLKKGGGEEQAAAATLFVLLCVQLGGGDEAEECFKMLRPLFSAILIDGGATYLRARVALGMWLLCVSLLKTE